MAILQSTAEHGRAQQSTAEHSRAWQRMPEHDGRARGQSMPAEQDGRALRHGSARQSSTAGQQQHGGIAARRKISTVEQHGRAQRQSMAVLQSTVEHGTRHHGRAWQSTTAEHNGKT